MDSLTILAIFLLAWGTAAILLAIFKPKKIWKIGKIQGFVHLLGNTGTTILFVIMGLAAIVGGILLLV
ncbi:MAG: hypothetical protein JEZ06_21440 [Anaerolineaceae bacterium]|nr:hypothetical protein [Anaerolineaceae bacterium]